MGIGAPVLGSTVLGTGIGPFYPHRLNIRVAIQMEYVTPINMRYIEVCWALLMHSCTPL